MLSDAQIAKFQMLYKTRFSKEISREDAYDHGVKLIRLMELIYRPMTWQEYVEMQTRRRETNN